MSKKIKPEATQDEAAGFAQASVDQAQIAFDKAADFAQDNFQTIDAATAAFKTRALDLQLKSVEFAQANFAAALDFTRKAWSLKDAPAFFQLNQDFAKTQTEAFQKQAAEINALSMALAKETFKPVQESFNKSFGLSAKAFAA